MGRPVLRSSELLKSGSAGTSGFDLQELRELCIGDVNVAHDMEVVPISMVWPMGFAWSSFVAQSTMLEAVISSGVTHEQLLCEESRLPLADGTSVSIATDDVVAFTRMSDEELASHPRSPLAPLDAAWADRGIRPKVTKQYDFADSAVVLGILVKAGIALCPRSSRLADALLGGADLLGNLRCSPARLASFAGLLQWMNLLNRPLYSCLHATFAFARLPDEHKLRDVWMSVVGELTLNLALFPLWVVDLCADWLDVVPVTDASPKHGYGMCFAHAPPWLERAGAVEAYGEHFFVLGGSESKTGPVDRTGRRVDFPVPVKAFKPTFSLRAKRIKHSGALEAEAVVLGLRRLARTGRNLGRRGLFLLDARAVEGTLRKGRSSAPSLRRPLMSAAAVQLAAGFRLRFGYAPSELNPADGPSRGVRTRPRDRRPVGAARRISVGLSRRVRSKRSTRTRSPSVGCSGTEGDASEESCLI